MLSCPWVPQTPHLELCPRADVAVSWWILLEVQRTQELLRTSLQELHEESFNKWWLKNIKPLFFLSLIHMCLTCKIMKILLLQYLEHNAQDAGLALVQGSAPNITVLWSHNCIKTNLNSSETWSHLCHATAVPWQSTLPTQRLFLLEMTHPWGKC